jgi:hypothetical protein
MRTASPGMLARLEDYDAWTREVLALSDIPPALRV